MHHAAAGAPLSDLTTPTPDGWVVLDREDLFPAVAALAAGRLRDHAAETN